MFKVSTKRCHTSGSKMSHWDLKIRNIIRTTGLINIQRSSIFLMTVRELVMATSLNLANLLFVLPWAKEDS